MVSAFGGVLAGALADRIGRVRTLMFTILIYSIFTFLSGLSQSYGQLLFFRACQGIGFGGEWAAGAILVAEVSDPEQRGRVLGAIQSFWAIGWGLALIAYTIVFSIASEDLAWRILFWLGILPALLVFYVRRRVREPEVFEATRRAEESHSGEAERDGAEANPLLQIFRSDLLKVTLAASVLSIGAQGGYYAIFTFLPTFLSKERGMSVVSTGGYLAFVIIGAFLGYVISGYVHDLIGRRPTFALFAIGSALTLVLYTKVAVDSRLLLFVLGLPLGFFPSGVFSGFGSYLAELFPTRARGAGQGLTYNFGRGVGAFFPALIGFLAASMGLAAAIPFGAAAYGLCLVALVFLPETRGKEFAPVE